MFMAAVSRLAVILSLLHECLINIMYTVLLRAVGLVVVVVVAVLAAS